MVAPVSEGEVVGTVGGLAPIVTVVTGTVVDGEVVVLVDDVVDGLVGGGGGNVDDVVDGADSGTVVDGIDDVVDGADSGTVVAGIDDVVDGADSGTVVAGIDDVVDVVDVVGLQHFTVVEVFHVVDVTGLDVVVHHQFQSHVVVVSPSW
jgi:hypothetical protein